MLGYYKRQIHQLSRQLHALRNKHEDHALLLTIQLQILARIKNTERAISRYRKALGTLKQQLKSHRLPRDTTSHIKHQITSLNGKIKHSQWMLFVWRCFGDGIAFIYLDKYAIKPLMYNVHDRSVKETSGYITGKSGLGREVALLRRIVNAGMPALLTDLTNCIRHGDICLLSDQDPQLIEVKSSLNKNRRVERQTEDIRTLHDYFDMDEATNIRGFSRVRRVALALPEQNYLATLDAAVSDALRNGISVLNLESSTRLIVIGDYVDRDYSALLNGMEKPVVYILNQAKNSGAWGSYYPFCLSLQTPDNLYAFLHGDVYVIVAFDLAQIQNMAASLGMFLSSLDDTDFVYQLQRSIGGSPGSGFVKLSRHFANRIALELLSWDWVLRVEQLRLTALANEFQDELT